MNDSPRNTIRSSFRTRLRPCMIALLVGLGTLAALPLYAVEISHWTFEEGSGTTTTDIVGTNDGMLMDGPVWTTDTGDGSDWALMFDGVDDRVETGHEGFFNLESLTVDVWFKPESLPVGFDASRRAIVSGGENSNNRSFGLYLQDDHIRFIAFDDSHQFSNFVRLPSPAGSITVNQWHHVIASIDATTGAIAMSINDVDVDPGLATIGGQGFTGEDSRQVLRNNNEVIIIADNHWGGIGSPPGKRFHGIIDNVLISGVQRPFVEGDFNDNGVVDAADYVLWRDNVGGPSTALANNTILGDVGDAHYELWRANFGLSLPVEDSGQSVLLFSSAANTVPEPTGILLALTLSGLIGALGNVRRRGRLAHGTTRSANVRVFGRKMNCFKC